MEFKYSDYIRDIENCPPNHYHNLDRQVYRWVHEDLSHPNNFLPTARISPQLVNDPDIDLQIKCKRYGLSFYNTLTQARKAYLRTIAEHGNLIEQVGKHIAVGQLSKEDGVGSRANRRNGHITFHEYAQADLQPKFSVVGRADENG